MELSGIYKNGYALEVTPVVKQVIGKKTKLNFSVCQGLYREF